MTSSQSKDDRPANAKAELERLTKLRRDVAAGLMEVSRSAKHDAETLLAADESSEIPDYPGGIDDIGPAAAQPAQTSNARLYSTFGLGLAIGLTVSLFFAPFGSESPDSANADAPERAPELATPRPTAPVAPTPPSPPAPEPVVDSQPEPAVEDAQLPSAEELVVSIKASGPCWISAEIDGDGAPVERLLSAGDEVVLEAADRAFLRIGDPSTISMSINGRETRSLGAPGRAVSLLVTLDNFHNLLNH